MVKPFFIKVQMRNHSFGSGRQNLGPQFFVQRGAPGVFHRGNVQLNYFFATAFNPQTIRTDITQQGHRATCRGDDFFDVAQRRFIKTYDDARRAFTEQPGNDVVIAGDVDVGAAGVAIK